MENPDLPQEILLEIFSRISTISVGKCRTLSKSWNTQLSTPNFIKTHLTFRKLTIQQENLALVMQRSNVDDRVCIVTSPTKKDELLQTIDIINTTRFRVLSSCDGLVLLLNMTVYFDFMLMNPITCKLLTIRNPRSTPSYYYSVVFGFGYDSCSNDYKIVQISTHKRQNITYVDVYSVQNCVWKKLDDGCYPYGGLVPGRFSIGGGELSRFSCEGGDFDFGGGYSYGGGDFVNGALHFLIYSEEGYRRCIAAFDLANEVFREIPLPKGFVRQLDDDVPRRLKRHCGLSVVDGCLLIVDNLVYGATDVWIMKEYGVEETWVKFHIESAGSGITWNTIVNILCFVEDGVLLCLTCGDSDPFAWNLKRGTTWRVVFGERDAWFASGVTFVDSLVSPEEDLCTRVKEKVGMYYGFKLHD